MRYSVRPCRLAFYSLLLVARLDAISMVYNLRIAQITKQPLSGNTSKDNYRAIGLAFDQYRKKYTGKMDQNFIGLLGSFIYDFKPYYVRVDSAFSHIQQITENKTTFSGTQADDILLTIGRNFVINKKTVITLSGLFGIPSHRIFRLQHTDFGYSQVGGGIQLDASYALKNQSALLCAARYIRFIPRSAYDTVCRKHLFTLGNIADILGAYKNNWGSHGFEIGYTARARFGARIYPALDDTLQKTNYIRSNFYLVYKYRFHIRNISSRFLCNISYGFDHKSKVFGNKDIITLWASGTISF
jgi:hypothetical protein